MGKVVLGFSGGVDSSVAARLLMEQGYEVLGLYLDTGGDTDVGEVRRAADIIGFPLKVADARAALEENVCRPFFEGYMRGVTPNPCILCNRAVKFRALCDYADALGAENIATGHYVRAEGGALYMGKRENDQSYMLCRLTRAQAARLLAPLGGFSKSEVRAMAEQYAVPAAHKPDSMEICFIPDNDHAAWMERRGGVHPAGNIIYNGKVVGVHGGIHRYTLGQRRGLGFAAGQRVYVSDIIPETNEVVLSDGDGLFVSALSATGFNRLADLPDGVGFRCDVRIRHSKLLYPALASLSGGELTVAFDSPVRAPTAGQSAALYEEDRLLGGGFITQLEKRTE